MLDRVLPFASGFGCSPLAMSPHTCKGILYKHKHAAKHSLINASMCSMCELCVCSHHGVSGCESGPEARVCPPRWIEEPAARAESTPSLAGSEEKKKHNKDAQPSWQQSQHSNSAAELTGKGLFNTVRSDHRGALTKNRGNLKTEFHISKCNMTKLNSKH